MTITIAPVTELMAECESRLASGTGNFIEPLYLHPPASGSVSDAAVGAAMTSLFGEYTNPGNKHAWITPDWVQAKTKLRAALTAALPYLQPIAATALTFEQKSQINAGFVKLYEAAQASGKHGHYENMFAAMHQAYAEATP